MKKLFLMAGLLAMLTPMAKAKPCVKRASFWVGEGVILGSVAADDWTTKNNEGLAGESNIGNHPSTRQIALFGLLSAGIESGLNLAACHVAHHVPIAASCTDHVDSKGHIREHCTEYVEDRLGWRIVGGSGIAAVTGVIYGYFGAYKNSQISAAHAAARNYILK